MNIQEILQELRGKGIIEGGLTDGRSLSGGTMSRIYAVPAEGPPRYMVKQNDAEITRAESLYLRTYEDVAILPRLIYEDKDHRFLVYSYMAGFFENPGFRSGKRDWGSACPARA
ncbi:hypothetical protein [Paenibacillus caui]|uniref:hypothetical protein n=1 Tax=Paenibacillus caui TaxID=2873927 RepID=UPI001F3F8081|nr:hypothetical protein [Paenibacillus caui]